MKHFFTFICFLFIGISYGQITNPILFDVSFNGDMEDQSNYQLSGKSQGDISYTQNRFEKENTAAYFPGKVDSYVSFGAPAHLNDLQEYSISLWLKGGSIEEGDSEILIILFKNYLGLYDRNAPTFSGLWDWDWIYNSYDYSNNRYNEGYGPDLWHHLVAIKTSDSIFLYRNGVLKDSSNQYHPYWKNQDSVIVGKGFQGAIDDITIYEGRLSKEDIHHLYTMEDIVTSTIVYSEKKEISFYPNPVHENLYLTSLSTVRITDGWGTTIVETSTTQHVDVSHLAPGIYFIRINDQTPVKLLKR